MALLVALALAPTIAHSAEFDHGPWDVLLKRHVVMAADMTTSVVDYRGLAQDRHLLKRYLDTLAQVAPATFEAWPKPEQMAFLINAYNAWTVELILRHYPKLKSIRDLGSVLRSPWKIDFIPLLAKTRSLDEIEHGMLRKPDVYNEPRIHFAVNCASIGCPALRNEAFVGERLDRQLDAATRAFLSDRSRNGVVGEQLHVSPIFKWYRQDFEHGWGGYNRLADFLGQYRQALSLSDEGAAALADGSLTIVFNDYDWTLNDIRR